jgi:hypothetical protein
VTVITVVWLLRAGGKYIQLAKAPSATHSNGRFSTTHIQTLLRLTVQRAYQFLLYTAIINVESA